MNLHLVEIAKTVAPGAHAVLLVDQAGWHMSTRRGELFIIRAVRFLLVPSRVEPEEEVLERAKATIKKA